MKKEETEIETIDKFDHFDNIKNNSNKVSAFLTIQEGCDKFCNFCVVPFTRGPEYSRPFKNIIKEAEQLILNGAREITLLGQNVNAYSYYEDKKELRISDLINELDKINELKRIRYTTSHPIDMTDDLIDCYSISKKLMPLIHLPIQSGSNKILKLMNRKHTVEDYIKIFLKLRKVNKQIKFSSDFIVGYPGEEENDFKGTIQLIKKIKFINSFSFIFSPRPGTKAAELNMLDSFTLKKRLKKLQTLLFSYQLNSNASLEGSQIEVLVENKIKGQNKFFGRNKYLNSVILNGSQQDIGKLVKVYINSFNQNTLFGTIIKNKIKAASWKTLFKIK